MFASCDKSDRENTYISQEERIDSYIASLDEGLRVVRNNGSNRVIVTEGGALDSLEVGDSLHFFYAGYTFSSSRGSLFSTNIGEYVRANNLNYADTVVKKILYKKGNMVDGLYNGLYHAHSGERCYVIFSAKYGYGNTEMFNVPKLTALFFDIQIEKIIKN